MCKKCGYDPYLAGKIVIFEAVFRWWIDDEDPVTHVVKQRAVEDKRVLTGRCIGHHNHYIKVNSAGMMFGMHENEDRVLAYYTDD